VKFVDVDLDTYTIDIDSLETAVEETNEVAAIVPVHLYGYPVNIEKLREIAPDVPIVSDSCQAHGASIFGKRIGSLSDLAAFSFYPSKNMTVGGDGGMVTTDDENLANAIRSYVDVGRPMDETDYNHTRIGYTARLDTFKAAIGRVQLENLSDWNQRRKEIARRFMREFQDIDLVLPPDSEYRSPAWYFFVVQSPNRDRLSVFLEERGIETGVHYPTPVQLQPPYRVKGFEPGDFPNSETWSDTVLSLPVHPRLNDNEVDHIISSVKSFFN